MPKLAQPIIEVAWRQTGETGRIHYRAVRPDRTQRHLIAKEGDALHDLLELHLAELGYTGPKSGAAGTDEH